ncbi:uncharacterized protein LOC135202265 [Macrobrachium nipponense]|uniref:uncharacterized protein LOC135202265 n=1 Tax=Macrobrachium nipponense TaxID=159736 RepID=UPI0030C7F812
MTPLAAVPRDNNEAENEIPLLPITPESAGVDVPNNFIGINSINPEDVDLGALVAFFNAMKENRNGMITADDLKSILNGRKPGLVTAKASSLTENTTPEPTTKLPTTNTLPPETTTTTATAETTTTASATASETTTTPLTTTSPSSEGPATFSTFPSNVVLQQRTGTAPTFRTSAPAAFPVFQQQQDAEQLEQEFEAQEAQEAQEAEFEQGEAHEQEQEQMFIPFHGEQPQTTDLLPFLHRAGMNTQVIRTQTLSSVQSIINSLPIGLKPIVLFRSGTGQLTELDAGTLLPLRRFGRSTTTTRGPKKTPGVLVTCDLDVSPCEFTPVGANWTVGSTSSEGRFAQAILDQGEGTQLLFQKLIAPPSTESVCVAVSHRRDLEEGGSLANATIPELMVGVMPIGGEVIRESLGGAPGMWEMSRVSFSNVKTSFLVVMTVAPASDRATVAVDALQITDGLCCMSGVC